MKLENKIQNKLISEGKISYGRGPDYFEKLKEIYIKIKIQNRKYFPSKESLVPYF